MSNRPEPGPESLELPPFVRTIGRIGTVGSPMVGTPGIVGGVVDGPGVLGPFGGVLGVRGQTMAEGWSVPPTLAYLVLRPLVVAALRDAGERRSTGTPFVPEAESTHEGSPPTETRVYEVLREVSGDGTTAERVRSWRPPTTTVARTGPARVAQADPSTSTAAGGPSRASPGAPSPGTTGPDRSDRPTPRTSAGDGRSSQLIPGDGGLTTASGPVADARVVRPVGRLPRLLVRREPGTLGPGEDDRPLVASSPSRLAVAGAPSPGARNGPGLATRVGWGDESETGSSSPGRDPGTTSGADAVGRPRSGVDSAGRRGDGRPPMEVRRNSTAGRTGESRERVAVEAGRSGGLYGRAHTDRADTGGPPDGTNGRTASETDERVSIDRLLEDPGSVGRLVDRLHHELDRKRRRERERRGL